MSHCLICRSLIKPPFIHSDGVAHRELECSQSFRPLPNRHPGHLGLEEFPLAPNVFCGFHTELSQQPFESNQLPFPLKGRCVYSPG